MIGSSGGWVFCYVSFSLLGFWMFWRVISFCGTVIFSVFLVILTAFSSLGRGIAVDEVRGIVSWGIWSFWHYVHYVHP